MNRLHTRTTPLIFTLSAAVVVCAAFVIHSKTAPPQKPGPSAKHVPAAQRRADSSLAVPVDKWPGRKFVVLKKPPMFRKFGYELYLTRELSARAAAIDTSVETERHHVRYDALAGHTITVSRVEPTGGEHLVTFSEDGSGRTLYAKTRQGAIEGLAGADELDLAARRWVGKSVYSRRRFLDTYDSLSGAYGTVKVRIQDKLKVTGVSWGLTPLPPKTVWLAVEAQAGLKGFIPVCATWTNVMAGKVLTGLPWEDDLFEEDPSMMYQWDSLTWDAINSHTIVSGMTKEQVTVSWGRPHKVTSGSTKQKCAEQWIYGNQYLCFERDSVTAVGAR